MSRHCVTGAAGVIGFDLTRALLERGDDVVAVDCGKKGGLLDLRALAEDSGGRLTLAQVDLCDDASPLEGRFDAVFHLAAIVGVRYVTENPYETFAVNARTTLNVLDRSIAGGCGAFLFASSSENYASGVDAGALAVPTPEGVPLSIADIALPRWSYAASKIGGESAVFGAAPLGGFTPAVVRFHNVYGPRMGATHVIPEMLARCRQRVDPFPVFGSDQTRSFLHVGDAARALLAVMDAALAGDGGITNVGCGTETRIEDLARVIFDVTDHHPEVKHLPAPPGSVRRRVPDVARLAALGFEPTVALRDGLRECWEAGG